jgi:hypothetical protein
MLIGDDDPKHGSWATYRNRALATALTLHESHLCSGCGQPLHESTDEDGPDYSMENYECRACKLIGSSDIGGKDEKPGTHWYLEVRRHSGSGPE